MRLQETLQTLGLSEKEAAIYVAGLELGLASVQALAVKTKIKRTTVYQVLEGLKEKELFNETMRGKRRLFVAAHPNQLKVLQNDRQRALDNCFDDLEKLAKVSAGEPKVELYTTLEGVHRMHEQSLKGAQGETIGIGSTAHIDVLGKDWLQDYVQKRQKQGLSARTILTDAQSAREWKDRDEMDGREIQILKEQVRLPVNIEVVGDTTIITSLEHETLGLSIKSEKVSTAMSEILGLIWDKY